MSDAKVRILDAVRPHFADRGFDGASTRELAAAAGVNVATLAWHFGDKQGLYDATIDGIYARIADLDLTPPPGPRDARIRALTARVYAFAREHREDLRILVRHLLDTRHLAPAVRERWLGPLLAKAGALAEALDVADQALPLLSLQHLVVRYAITEDDDLALTTGATPSRVADHLGDVAVRLLAR